MDARTTPARLERARRRAAATKRGLTIASIAGLLVALLLGRASHPAGTSSQPPATSSPSTAVKSEDDNFGFSGGSFSPSTSTPQLQTHVS
jgi:hypothetical protein